MGPVVKAPPGALKVGQEVPFRPAQAAWNPAAQGAGFYAESSNLGGLTVLQSTGHSHTPATYSSASMIAPQITTTGPVEPGRSNG